MLQYSRGDIVATIYDIAKKVKLSTATVSRALNGHNDVKPATKKRVLDAASELGYLPNSLARSLTMKKSWNIGLLFSDDRNSGLKHVFFANVINKIIDTAAMKGYDISIISGNLGKVNRSYLEHARYRMFDGVIIAAVDTDNPIVEELISSDIPVAMIDQNKEGVICINSRNKQGMKTLVSHLYEKGHKKITYITGQQDNYVALDRMNAFIDKTKELGIYDECKVVEGFFTDTEKGYELTKKIMESSDKPTAILYGDDLSAIGGLKYCIQNNIKIPDDLAIAGYDGIDISQLVTPRLTTIKQDVHNIGLNVALELIKQIENDDYKPIKKWIDVSLLIGETT